MGSTTVSNFSFKESKLLQIRLYFVLYYLFIILIINFLPISKNILYPIYLYLKNLINIQLIPLKSEFIMIYTSTIFLFLIITITFISIILIYSYKDKKVLFINTKYNILIITTLTIFGIIGIIYSFLLNYFANKNIIYLTDNYLIFIYLLIYLLILFLGISRFVIYYSISNREKIYLKEKDAKIRKFILIISTLIVISLHFFFFLIRHFVALPWYIGILIFFYLYIIFEIIRKKYFLNKKTFYQDLYKLSKYFDKRFIIFFGILAFVAIFDVHNLVLWKNYTIQTLLKPATIDESLIFPTLIVSSFIYIFCFLIYFMSYYHFHYYYYFHYYILAENIGHKVEEGYVKISQVNPMITILSYLELLIVFLINLIL